VPLYKLWAAVFGADLSEVDGPLVQFENLNTFFTRPLKAGVRPLQSGALVSPVDGRIVAFGQVPTGGQLPFIKNMSYAVDELLGAAPVKRAGEDSALFYCIIYLAPGDYHRMHAASNFLIRSRTHFVGEKLPVAPAVAAAIPDLFTRNERVVLTGEWEHGFFSFVPVGAFNVGSISLTTEPTFAQEQAARAKSFSREGFAAALQNHRSGGALRKDFYREALLGGMVDRVSYGSKGFYVPKGHHLATFELGSTVVLVFEAPAERLRFRVSAGQRLKMGQNLCTLSEEGL
jgi:phosphatidylserine decarboxylase